mgnify:CR=1 FL=1
MPVLKVVVHFTTALSALMSHNWSSQADTLSLGFCLNCCTISINLAVMYRYTIIRNMVWVRGHWSGSTPTGLSRIFFQSYNWSHLKGIPLEWSLKIWPCSSFIYSLSHVGSLVQGLQKFLKRCFRPFVGEWSDLAFSLSHRGPHFSMIETIP